MTECSITGCVSPAKTRGWCATHYMRWLRNGDPQVRSSKPPRQTCEYPECEKISTRLTFCDNHYRWYRRQDKSLPHCVIEGCDNPVYARSICTKHYVRWQKHGDPHTVITVRHPGDAEARFWAKVDKSQGCWIWQAAKNPAGYGIFPSEAGDSRLAHRFSYTLKCGPIPEGLSIDHVCGVPACVNPDHLRAVTHKQNIEHAVKIRSNNTSGILGVTWHKVYQKWQAQVKHNGKYYYAGRFANIEDAEAAVIAKRNELFTHNDRDRGQESA